MMKLILADSQGIFRAGMAKVLAVEEDMRIVAQTQTPEQMFSALEKLRPSVLICGANFHPDLAAILDAAKKATVRVMLIIENGEDPAPYFTMGAHGIVFRNVSAPTLLDSVRKLARGETCCQDAAIPKEVIENDMVGARVRDRLTPKELRIVALIVQGYKNKEIAGQLGTTEQVIKNYLRNVYDKIGVSDRLELALFTIHHHILAEAAAATTLAAAAQRSR